MSLGKPRRDRFPGVLLQLLGHLSALKSNVLPAAESDYRRNFDRPPNLLGSAYEGSHCQVLSRFQDRYTHLPCRRRSGPAQSRARVGGRFIITPITTPAFPGRAVEQTCLELAAAGSGGRQLRPRPTPIRASLSGLIPI